MSGDPSAWAKAMAAIGEAGDRLCAEMAARGGGADRADVLTTMLGALMDSYLNLVTDDPDRPQFLPCTGYFQRLGSPNPDTVYRRAPVDPQGTYRLTGERGAARDVTIMPFTAEMRGLVPFDLSQVACGPDGSFAVVASAVRPEGYQGDFWQLAPETASLWLREVSDRWGEEREARVAIVRLDEGGRRRPLPELFDARIAGLATRVERIVEYGIRHVDGLRAEHFVNRLKQVDYGASGAMPLQFYHEGIFDLADDECLLVEARMPPDCGYFSWSLTDSMLVTLDWMNARTSLNSAQAKIDADGVLRVAVSKADPGTPNWMDTLGYREGVLQCRSNGSPAPPDFALQVVPLAEVFDRLPPGNRRVRPDERRESLRLRQCSWQMRRLW